MNYNILASGSSGNCVIINDNIAVDMGIPFKKVEQYAKDLRLVLLTHAHGDHFKQSTVRTLHKRHPAIRWGCCDWMVGPLLDAGVDKRAIHVYTPEKPYFYFALALNLSAVVLTHDVSNCGYRIHFSAGSGNMESLFYATDCATLDGIKVERYDWYFIESNHRRDEIDARIAAKRAAGEYAYDVQARRNHLSEEQALDWLAQNMGPNSRYVFLHQHKEDKHGR